ncbi:restriction endonuclease (plasmid) [Haloarcula sp. NS06]|uniref:restriction endonuclease n=1 Tax=Haloarcula sp. NS06 TaxID=3409688 RepID=UPI003DA781DE
MKRVGLERIVHNLLPSRRYLHSDWDESNLRRRNWRAFERLIAVLWSNKGYETTLLEGKQDGGVDVIAKKASHIPFSTSYRIAIQAKNWSKKIREPKIRDLFGVQNGGHRHSNTDRFDESILVTSFGCSTDKKGFTMGAREFAEDNGVTLIDGETLLDLLNKSNISPLPLGRKPDNKWHLLEPPRCGWSKKFSQNQSFAQTTQKIHNSKTGNIGPKESSPDISRNDICELCLKSRIK